MLVPLIGSPHLTSLMYDNASPKVKQDRFLDPRLAEFLSDEDRYRQQIFVVFGVALVATVCLVVGLFMLWAMVAS